MGASKDILAHIRGATQLRSPGKLTRGGSVLTLDLVSELFWQGRGNARGEGGRREPGSCEGVRLISKVRRCVRVNSEAADTFTCLT